VAYHAFLSMKVCHFHAFTWPLPITISQVNATILEVGVGGRYDSTNIVPRPLVTGITALGIDHVGVLGKTLPEIAWQKAGIYKVLLVAALY
jgi:folylpolyglutamate synthase/dihydropteroate synthase